MASMNIPAAAPGARPVRPSAAGVASRQQAPQPLQMEPMARAMRPAPTSGRPAAPVSLNATSLQDTIAAARARIEAKLSSQGIKPSGPNNIRPPAPAITQRPPPTVSAPSASASASTVQPTELHPMLRADFKSLSSKTARPAMPRISTIKANQRKEEPKKLKIEHEVPASFTDPQKNPYLDPSLGRYTKVEPRQRKHGKQFQFVRPGRYVEQADKLRAEAKVEQLKAEIKERAAKARLEEEVLDVNAIRPTEPPLIEWWDAPFLAGDTYADVDGFKLDGPDSLVSIYVQHPVPLQPPGSITNVETAPSKIFLTQKERKKIRRQRRMEQQREHREKVMLGLLPPDQPKLRMSNFMRIMANQSVPDPTKLEAEVRRQMKARVEKHEAENRANKLTKEQKTEKHESKAKAEETKGIISVLFRVRNLKHPQHRYKVSVNARQLHLTGTALVCPEISIILVEGAEKFIKTYKKLLLRRIDWSVADTVPSEGSEEPLRADASDDMQDSAEQRDSLPDGDADVADANNQCHLVWQGQIQERRFNEFRVRDCPTETQAKNWLAGAGCEALWRVAKQFDPENSASGMEPLV
ncbi:U4/U5/U6 small nuclear ribonucleoprotein prp3 [Coemansia sp. IMI 203386]|nr:U4/U5/U6 small nuclear ribonucleoprotein prp3 [Coemansia sp. IMI 203386]